jgi:hypothetical protein
VFVKAIKKWKTKTKTLAYLTIEFIVALKGLII